MKIWEHIPQFVKYIALGLGVAFATLCFAVLFYWSYPFESLGTYNTIYDPPGGCLGTDAPDQVELFRYFDIPESAKNITVISDKPATDICYVMVRFDLAPAEAAAFIDESGIEVISASYSGGFWFGAHVAEWPLVEGGVYTHGRSSKLRNEI